jgi:4-amino-4-deoxy-L-arabinose transferase-like glycosyltransferase
VKASLKRLASSAAVIAAVALALRLAILWWTWHRAAPAETYEPFGFEAGRIAESIASGGGFSSPLLLVKTGPTAYLCPIYPYLLAGIFKIWGIYSFKSEVIAQALNCLFAALTVFPIFAVAKRTFGVNVAVFASWLWVVLPNAWHLPIAYVWDTTLTALWFALVFWSTVALREKSGLARWAGCGVLWAIGALINATILSVLPFLFLWLIWQAHRESKPWFRPVLAAALVFIIGVAPWTIRNYRVFGKVISTRSPFGLVLWIGNNSSEADENSFSMHPVWNPVEADKFKQMGEIAYMSAKKREALAFMRSHPAETVERIAKRIPAYWLQVTDRPYDHLLADPPYIKALFLLNAVVVLFGWLGGWLAWRRDNSDAVPYFVVLLVFPLVYYLTDTLVRYRFLIDPLLIVLAAYGAACSLERLEGRSIASRVKVSLASR